MFTLPFRELARAASPPSSSTSTQSTFPPATPHVLAAHQRKLLPPLQAQLLLPHQRNNADTQLPVNLTEQTPVRGPLVAGLSSGFPPSCLRLVRANL